MSIKIGSMFAGIGGFDLGFQNNGFEVSWAIEWDKKCQSILKRHFSHSDIKGDISEVKSSDLKNVDIITFGSPCQDLSHAGRREGLDGSRSKMFFEAIRIIGDLNPSIAIWENVTGALSSNNGNDFSAVLNKLSFNKKRKVAYRVLDSKYFGVAQRRRRLFAVSCAEDIDPRKILQFENMKEKELLHDCSSMENSSCFSIQDVRSIDKMQNGKGWSSENISYTLDTKATQGIAMLTYGFKPGQSSAARTDGANLEVCPTLEAGGGGNNKPAIASFGGGECIARRITPEEAEALQGFPSGWTEFGLKDNGSHVKMSNMDRFKQLGNAVTVNVASWIASNVKKAYSN
jgi:DNA (cytosine-5)-methyltransferase 1